MATNNSCRSRAKSASVETLKNAFFTTLMGANKAVQDEVPPGFYSIEDWCVKVGKSRSQMDRDMSRLVSKKRAIKRLFCVMAPGGRLRNMTFLKLI